MNPFFSLLCQKKHPKFHRAGRGKSYESVTENWRYLLSSSLFYLELEKG